MGASKVLIANRGEIAIRIMRAAAELDIRTVAVFSEDDRHSSHVYTADEAHALVGRGVEPYLDITQIVRVARELGCDAIHPGYGFLAESPGFAQLCAAEGINFVGPSAPVLDLLGNKIRARGLAVDQGVPVLPGTAGSVTIEEACAFFASLAEGEAMVIKAVAGGGGRGMRVVWHTDEIAESLARCQSEAKAAFGTDAVYVESLMRQARHVEIQIVGDGRGGISHLGERECSVQRRYQKLIEVAPSPTLSEALREKIATTAVRMATALSYSSLGTFEFLVDAVAPDHFVFMEANPRLQVEHTVTEEVTGVDLVKAQLRIARGETLAELGLEQAAIARPRGFAIQARVNAEQMKADGQVFPSFGILSVFAPPLGPGIRVDTAGSVGYKANPQFDSLLAKVVGHSESFADAAKRTALALKEFQIAGIDTNISFLRNILAHPDYVGGKIYTNWVDEHFDELATPSDKHVVSDRAQAGAMIDRRDPLAALDFFRHGEGARSSSSREASLLAVLPNTMPISAPLQGTVIEIGVTSGDAVRQGQQMFIMTALKMEHVVKAPFSGLVQSISVVVGDTVMEGDPLAFVEPMDLGEAVQEAKREVDPGYLRPSLQALLDRRKFLLDENRPEAVERRHSKGHLTVRENIAQLIDEGTWVEYGPLTIAGQRARRSLEELIRKTPADGLVAGIGSVNGDLFDEKRARTIFISYDATVFAGTQGVRGHDKTDRMLELADQLSLPVIFHAEGAGGRSGDTEILPNMFPAGRTFETMAKLSGKVPMIGVTAGWCYAGNAAILSITDVIIATEDALIAMGGPATIEGTGMGAFLPEEVGPISDVAPAGAVDIVVKNHDEAIQVSKKCLSYFQGSVENWECADQRLLRHVIPENRLRGFDVREVIRLMADKDSVLELRPYFGVGVVTAFVRIEGHPFGLTANNNAYISGAVDSSGSDKIARFWQICDAFNIPIITLVDTAGMMVGPEVEKTGLVRHSGRLFVTGANLETPRFAVVLRKGYALGSLAMMTGSSRAPLFAVGWPDSEYGGMNVESGILLAHRQQLEEIVDVEARAAEYERLVAEAYDRASALNSAAVYGIDDVIDPAETRRWIVDGLRSVPNSEPLRRGRRPFLDTW